jgi:MFS family permease
METVALGTLIARTTGKASAVALVAAAAFLPVALCGPIGGAIADRVDRHRFLMATLAGETFFAALLAVVVGAGVRGPGALSAIVFAESCVSALALPNRQSMMPDLVPPEHLLAAISLSSAAWNGGRVVGPLLAAPLIAVFGAAGAFTVNAASFAVMLVAVLFMKLPTREILQTGESVVDRLRDGVRTARMSPGIRSALVTVSVMACTAAPFIGLLPIVARKEFRGGAGTTGAFVTAQGIGAVIGAMALPKLAARFGRATMLIVSMCTLVAALLVYGTARPSWLATVAIGVVGAGYFSTMIGWQTVLQLSSPPNLRARVVSLFSIALGLPYVFGLAVQGPLADHVGLRKVMLGGPLAFAAGLLMLRLLTPGWATHVNNPEVFSDASSPAANQASASG